MMKRVKLMFMALAAVAACLPALAQLAVFDGAWTCNGEVPEGPLGPAHKTRTSVNFHKDLDGMWYSGRVEEAASKENPSPFKGMAHMGGWVMQTSSGWTGDRIVWSGDGSMAGQKVSARGTFTKKGSELEDLGELQMDGKWVVVQNEQCNRPAPKE